MSKYSRTPKGRLEWAKVVKPDTKFDEGGIYSVDLYLKAGEPDVQELCAKLDELVEEAKQDAIEENPKRKPLTAQPYEAVTDDEGNETGEIKFKFKLKATGKTKAGEVYKQRPIVVDAKGVPILKFNSEGDVINDGFKVGNGSIGKIAFEPKKYFMASTKTAGVSLRLRGVQLIKLVEFSGGGDLFEEEEGYEFEDKKDTNGNKNKDKTFADESGDGEDDGDF